MADENFNGESAAHIIWQAAQDYNINPQVLIVLLQKEQSLITDTWPNSRQYQTATGFGCPDTAPCDAQYYGLKNQVRQAANLFRTVLNGGWSNYPAYTTKYIQYNPNAACGGSNVYIENRATSALYRYTPYQPNAHAMSGGSSSAYPQCGAFGNRNFYSYFTDWFGSTQTDAWIGEVMLDPRIMEVSTDTCKIRPSDMHIGCEGSDRLVAGQIVSFEQKKDLYTGETCLRTRSDSINGINKCVLMKRLSEFVPTFNSLPPDENIEKYNTQYTCKIDLHTLNITSSCFNPHKIIQFASTTTIGSQTYLITKVDDKETGGRLGFLIERFVGADNLTILGNSQTKTSKHFTCKIDLPKKTVTDQCFNAPLTVNFAQEIVLDGVNYLKTQYDFDNNLNTVFLNERFI